MGSNLIFHSLLDIFPQVDARILKAVAFEHSKDAGAAVESVLFEVLPTIFSTEEVLLASGHNKIQYPLIGEVCVASHSCTAAINSLVGNENVEPEEPSSSLKHQEVVKEDNADPPSELSSVAYEDVPGSSVAYEDVPGTDHMIDTFFVKSTSLDEAGVGSSVSGVHVKNDNDRLSVYTATEELVSSTNHREEVRSNHVSYALPSTWTHEDAVVTSYNSNSLCPDIQELHGEVSHYSVSAVCGGESGDHQDHSCLTTDSSKVETSIPHFKFFPHDVKSYYVEHGAMDQMDVNTSVSECEEPGSSCLLESGAKQLIFDNEMVDVDDESLPTTIATRSGQNINVDFLEEFITDAKSNKKMLDSAMESILSMAREVEIQEKAAEQAKEEALRGGLDVLTKVEDLRQMLQHAKETNGMHAGEVYGERAILATEARELQSRLLNLSDQRDKSLVITDEMHWNLEARLAAAEAEKSAAEQEKVDKEEYARKGLAEQTLIMEKVVQESKKLQKEAEENAKLREFLVDCGRKVDILQGEIAVICEDVKLLKERIDGRLPINKSLVLSQTSSSLTSSSTLPYQVLERSGSSMGLKKTASQELPNSEPSENSTSSSVDGNAVENTLKVSSEDEWDLLDTSATVMSTSFAEVI